jgi:hypothetical protein
MRDRCQLLIYSNVGLSSSTHTLVVNTVLNCTVAFIIL